MKQIEVEYHLERDLPALDSLVEDKGKLYKVVGTRIKYTSIMKEVVVDRIVEHEGQKYTTYKIKE